jgi:hypothetical protein
MFFKLLAGDNQIEIDLARSVFNLLACVAAFLFTFDYLNQQGLSVELRQRPAEPNVLAF